MLVNRLRCGRCASGKGADTFSGPGSVAVDGQGLKISLTICRRGFQNRSCLQRSVVSGFASAARAEIGTSRGGEKKSENESFEIS